MKKAILAFVVVVWSCMSFGHAFAATPLGVTKQVSMAGTGGLEVAARKCADKVGTGEWQSCIAHHDGLYSLNRDGSVSRNYVRDEKAPQPRDGEVECLADGFATIGGQVVWEVRENPSCHFKK